MAFAIVIIPKISSHTSGDYRSYPSINPMKPPKFDDPTFKCLGTHQEVEALQLSLMVISGSHIPDETPKPSQIRVSNIRDSAHHTPLNIILPVSSSSRKAYYFCDVSLRKYFHFLSANMHQPLYPNFFVEGSALAIASNIFYCHLVGINCE